MRDEGITVSAGCRPFGTPIRCPMSGLGRAELEEFHLVLCPKNSSVPGWYTVVWLRLCVLGYWKGFQHFYTEHSVSFFSTKISSKFFFLQFLTHWRIPLQKAWLITFMVRWLPDCTAIKQYCSSSGGSCEGTFTVFLMITFPHSSPASLMVN